MIKKLGIILFMLLVILIQIPSLKANALSSPNELQVNTPLEQWILDEPTNTLYAISNSGKSLLFINATTMNIEKTMALNGMPSDIIRDNGKLYIALGDVNQVVIVDMINRSIEKTIYTTSDPYRIVKEGEVLYYTERDQWCNIYEYDLLADKDKMLPIGLVYQPDLAINTDDHILYIAESGLSGSDMKYYSTSEDRIISETNYDNGYGFPYPERYVIFDGEKVYFAGFGLDKLNATRILGKYDEQDITFAKYGCVFTKTRVYDSYTYKLVGDYGVEIDLYEISDNLVLYFYSKAENIIIRVDPSKDGWVQENGKRYYYELGIKKIGWLFDGGRWYFLKQDGSMATGWILAGGKWYYLENSGAMKTGWLLTGGKWYYLEGSGVMKTGWLLAGGKWYYLEGSGAMKTGWLLSGGKWYYLYSSGEMAANTRIGSYKIGASGAWIQ